MYIAFRFTFKNEGNQRSWTETFYKFFGGGTPDSTGVKTAVRGFAAIRSTCLAQGNVLVTVTLFDPSNPHTTVIVETNFPGAMPAAPGGVETQDQDIVVSALMVKLIGTSRNRQYLMRGLPDYMFFKGNYAPTPLQGAVVQRWLDTITGQQFANRQFNSFNIGGGGFIATVFATGVTLTAPVTAPLNKGDLLSVHTQIAGGGPTINTRVKMTGDTAVGQSTIPVSWNNGNCEGGKAKVMGLAFTQINETVKTTPARTRKTGGPLGKFRGRVARSHTLRLRANA